MSSTWRLKLFGNAEAAEDDRLFSDLKTLLKAALTRRALHTRIYDDARQFFYPGRIAGRAHPRWIHIDHELSRLGRLGTRKFGRLVLEFESAARNASR